MSCPIHGTVWCTCGSVQQQIKIREDEGDGVKAVRTGFEDGAANCIVHFCPMPCDTCDLRSLRKQNIRLVARVRELEAALTEIASHWDECQNLSAMDKRVTGWSQTLCENLRHMKMETKPLEYVIMETNTAKP